MITYPISSNLCKKKILCYVIGFTIFHLSKAATGGVLLEKVFLEILQNSQENTCAKVSFLIKAEVTASYLSHVLSWRFLVYFISTEKWNEKRKIPRQSSNIYFFARVSICLTSRISKEIWQMVVWSKNVFKGNLKLQFSWLEEFRQGKVCGWWTLDQLQYENGLKINFRLCTNISNRLLHKTVPAFLLMMS